MNWEYFVIGLITYQIIKILALASNQEIIERRRKKFFKMVNIEFPDNTKITFLSVDSSDKRAMAKLEREISENFDLTEKQAKDIIRGKVK